MCQNPALGRLKYKSLTILMLNHFDLGLLLEDWSGLGSIARNTRTKGGECCPHGALTTGQALAVTINGGWGHINGERLETEHPRPVFAVFGEKSTVQSTLEASLNRGPNRPIRPLDGEGRAPWNRTRCRPSDYAAYAKAPR